MTTTFENPQALLVSVGLDLGATPWIELTQERIDQFAAATGDHQWIHVDPARAKDGPFGATVAHGYLTLAITNLFLPQLIEVQDTSMGINYGANKVRFPAPVVEGSRVRGRATVTDVSEITGGVQVIITITVEIEGGEKPACVVESISRFLS